VPTTNDKGKVNCIQCEVKRSTHHGWPASAGWTTARGWWVPSSTSPVVVSRVSTVWCAVVWLTMSTDTLSADTVKSSSAHIVGVGSWRFADITLSSTRSAAMMSPPATVGVVTARLPRETATTFWHADTTILRSAAHITRILHSAPRVTRILRSTDFITSILHSVACITKILKTVTRIFDSTACITSILHSTASILPASVVITLTLSWWPSLDIVHTNMLTNIAIRPAVTVAVAYSLIVLIISRCRKLTFCRRPCNVIIQRCSWTVLSWWHTVVYKMFRVQWSWRLHHFELGRSAVNSTAHELQVLYVTQLPYIICHYSKLLQIKKQH